MKHRNLDEPYIYQPEPVNSQLAPRIYAVSGPGAEHVYHLRLTKDDAEKLLARLKAERTLNKEQTKWLLRMLKS